MVVALRGHAAGARSCEDGDCELRVCLNRAASAAPLVRDEPMTAQSERLRVAGGAANRDDGGGNTTGRTTLAESAESANCAANNSRGEREWCRELFLAESAAQEQGVELCRSAPLVFPLPPRTGQISITDMDADGWQDLIFFAADPHNESATALHIWYGDGSGVDACPTPSPRLCSAQHMPTLRYNPRVLSLPSGWKAATAATGVRGDGAHHHQGRSTAGAPPVVSATWLSVGDLNQDGFPEVSASSSTDSPDLSRYSDGGGRRC